MKDNVSRMIFKGGIESGQGFYRSIIPVAFTGDIFNYFGQKREKLRQGPRIRNRYCNPLVYCPFTYFHICYFSCSYPGVN